MSLARKEEERKQNRGERKCALKARPRREKKKAAEGERERETAGACARVCDTEVMREMLREREGGREGAEDREGEGEREKNQGDFMYVRGCWLAQDSG